MPQPTPQNIKKALAAADDAWAKSQKVFETDFGGEKIPEGTYAARITQCGIRESANGNLRVNRKFVIIEGDYEGSVARDGMNIGNEQSNAFVRQFIAQCGYQQPASALELPELFAAIEKDEPEFKIQIKHNGEFLNVRILEALGAREDNDDELAEADEAGTDEAGTDEEAAEGGEEADDSARLELIAFAAAWSITEVTDDSTLEEVKEALKGYEFEEAELTPEEVKTLEENGLADRIKRKPAPKAAPKAAPKPAPKAAPAKAVPGKKGPVRRG